MKYTLSNLMDICLGGDPALTRWQRFKLRLHLLRMGRGYTARRRRILWLKARHRAQRLLRAELQKPSWMANISKNDHDFWTGGTLVVPFSKTHSGESKND